MSLSLKIVKSDIKTARLCLTPVYNWFNDENLYSNAAYHAEQAIEKCLKIILTQNYGISETERRYRTHDIPDLLAYIEECRESSGKDARVEIPEIIDGLSIEIKAWEANTRYNDNMVILRKKILKVVQATEKLQRDMAKEGYI